jgi:RES domain-containing protein
VADLLWRIARRPYALDRLGVGARDHGGRWNRPGTAVIYTGQSVAVSALETLVHTSGVIPPDLVLVRIELPDPHTRSPHRVIYRETGMRYLPGREA